LPPSNVHFHIRSRSFAADANVRVEIVKYDGSWGRYVDIWTEHGEFEVAYHADGLNRVDRLRDVLETAVVFHDRLKIIAQ
jgi:hypothetical protein